MSHPPMPLQVEVVNHPEPKRYERRAAYRTAVLTVANPFTQIASFDPLRECIRFSPAANPYVISGSISQASDVNNVTGGASNPANPVPAQPAVPATGVAQQNVNSYAVSVAIAANGATITNVSVNGITVGTAAGTYTVPGFGAISIAYSVAVPTWAWTYAGPALATVITPPANPNGRLIPASTTVEIITEGQNDIWLTGNVYPTIVGYEIIRKVPE